MRKIALSFIVLGDMSKPAKFGMLSFVLTAVLCIAPLHAFGEDKKSGGDTPTAHHEHSAESPGFPGTTGSAEKEAKIHGHEEGLVAEHGLTGNWGGLRDTLVANGVTIKAVYAGENSSSFSGGALNKTGSIYHDNLDLTLSVDTGKAGLWRAELYGYTVCAIRGSTRRRS